MQFIEFKRKLKDFVIFSLNDIRKIEVDFDLRRLNEWAGKNYIRKIKRGYYIFSDLQINEQILFLIANTIYQPSYISLEMAFSLYNLIPEGVYKITAITSKKTNNIKTDIGNFTYKHIKPELMFGYELREYDNHRYSVAEIEKAALDYLYLNSHINSKKDFDGLRFNFFEFKIRADMNKFKKYSNAFHNKALSVRVNEFISYIK
jgi:predicted transcriptional regulator of viral defense system